MKKILFLLILFASCNNSNENVETYDTTYTNHSVTHDTVTVIYDTVYIDSIDIAMIKVLKESDKFTLEQIAKRFDVYPAFIKQF